MDKKQDNLYVVVPVYNEAESIGAVLDEWIPVCSTLVSDCTFLIVDDGSTDNTAAIVDRYAAECAVLQVVHQENSGHGQTCIKGYRMALERGADWVFQIDSDGQCDSQYFNELWRCRDQYLAQLGLRISRGDGLLRKAISRICGVVCAIATGVYVADPNVPYRIMNRRVLEVIVEHFPRTFHLANIPVALILKNGLGDRDIRFVPIGFRDRLGGEPAVSLFKFASRGLELYQNLRRIRSFIDEKACSIRNMCS